MSALAVSSDEQREMIQTEYGEVQIAPFAVARVGGLPVQVLDQLLFSTVVEQLEQVFTLEETLQTLCPAVEEALYRLVPRLEDDVPLRRRVLAMKRHVHNMRLWDTAAQDVASVCAALAAAGEDGAALAEWYRLATQREQTLRAAEESYERAHSQAERALAAAVANTEFQQGLALTSPDLLRALRRQQEEQTGHGWRPAGKLVRSCLAYLTRAALKTSPLSTFTRMALVEVGQACSERTYEQEHRIVRLTRLLPASWVELLARHPLLAAALDYEPHQGLTPSARKAGVMRVLTTTYTFHHDFAWRDEKVVERRFDERRAARLCAFLRSGRATSYRRLLEMMPCPAERAPQLFALMVEMQLIRPIAPYRRREARPLLALAQALDALEAPLARTLAARMRAIQELVEASLHADGAQRLALGEQLRQNALWVFQELGQEPPAWLKTANLLYEDMYAANALPLLPAQVREDLAQVAAVLRPAIIRSRLYDYLYRAFVERFGERGETSDILGFLEDFLEREDLSELLARSVAEDHIALQQPGHVRSALSGGASAIPPAVTFFYQIAAESQEAVERGEYQLVVNQVCSGEGGLLGRFSDLLDNEHGALRARLSNWLRVLYDGRPVLEVPVVGDWHNLQGETGVGDGVLRWPAEQASSDPSERTIELRDLRLRARPEDETLVLVDRQGQVVAPCYMGVVPVHLMGHAIRLFLVLLNPWTSDYPVGWGTHRASQRDQPPREVEFYPRQQQGRVVLRRARWCFPKEEIPRRQKGEGDFAFFVRLQRWRRHHRLPEEVYLSTMRAQLAIEARARKPVWLHFACPYTLELLTQVLDDDVLAVCLTEALPGRHQHWVRVAAERTDVHACEFMSLACWPMPRPVPKRSAVIASSVDQSVNQHWLYFKIYPAASDQMEDLVRQIVRPVVERVREQQALLRWFFIRYIDRRGWHIRLRLLVPAGDQRELAEAIGSFIEQNLARLSSEARPPLLSFLPAVPVVQGREGYTLDEYRPEWEKYGGRLGVALAERLFEYSSEVALQAICEELEVLPLSLRLMQETLGALQWPGNERATFWRRYLWYWSGQNQPGAAALRAQIARQVADQYATLSSWLAPQEDAARPLVECYRQAIKTTIEDLARAGDQVPVAAGNLCFDYIHMMNNRLGVMPLEESYLAAILLAREEARERESREPEEVER